MIEFNKLFDKRIEFISWIFETASCSPNIITINCFGIKTYKKNNCSLYFELYENYGYGKYFLYTNDSIECITAEMFNYCIENPE